MIIFHYLGESIPITWVLKGKNMLQNDVKNEETEEIPSMEKWHPPTVAGSKDGRKPGAKECSSH